MEQSTHENQHSDSFALASFILGIVGLATGLFVFTSIIFGSLAILFALLSRGGSYTMPNKSKVGIIFGSMGILFGIIVITLSAVFLVNNSSEIVQLLEEYVEENPEMFYDENFDFELDFKNPEPNLQEPYSI